MVRGRIRFAIPFFFFFITDKIFNYFYIFHSSPQVSGVNAEEATPPQC